jgi:hypothetical protein
MADKNYTDYIGLLHSVRSPIDRSDVEQILANRRSRKRGFIGMEYRQMTLVLAVAVMLVFNRNWAPASEHAPLLSVATQQARVAGRALIVDGKGAEANVRYPQTAQVKVVASMDDLHLKGKPVTTSRAENNAELVDSLILSSNVRDVGTAANMHPIDAGHFPLTDFNASTVPANPLSFGISSDLLHPSDIRISTEYELWDHVRIGLESGMLSRSQFTGIAAVRFHDTTVSSNGTSYESTIGELVPASKTTLGGFAALSARVMLNDATSPWNLYSGLSGSYSAAHFGTSIFAGGRTRIFGEYWFDLVYELADALRSDRRSDLRAGILIDF